jgi:folate-binding protein YgfZ
MKPEWRRFLTEAGAELRDQRVVSFGNPERELQIATTGNVLCDLSHFGLIGAYGPEAFGFLQAQLTSDVRAVSEQCSQLSGYCGPNGRVLVAFLLFKRGDTYYLRLPREMLEAMLSRLRMFVLRAKITLEDASDALIRCGWSGPTADEELKGALATVPQDVNHCVQASGVTAIRVRGTHPRFELYGELSEMKRLWGRLNVGGGGIGAPAWELLDILAGVPQILPQASDRFLPQMINLDLLGGVSFSKGCYPGQEVIARTRYLGSVKRCMYRLHSSSDVAIQPGDSIFAEGQDAEPSGAVLNAQGHPDGGVELLAVLRTADVGKRQLHIGSADGDALEVRSLPYEVPLRTDSWVPD